MRCFNHENPAVAVCQGCGKGLCQQCVAMVEEDMLACQKQICQDKVKIIHSSIMRNKRIFSALDQDHKRNAMFYIVMGAIFSVFAGIFLYHEVDYVFSAFMAATGGIFLVAGACIIKRSRFISD